MHTQACKIKAPQQNLPQTNQPPYCAFPWKLQATWANEPLLENKNTPTAELYIRARRVEMLFSKFVFPNKSASRRSAFPRAGEEARARREAGTAPTLSISPAKPQDRALSTRFQQEQGALLRTASGEGQEKGGETAGARQRCSTGGGDHLLPHKYSQFMHFSPLTTSLPGWDNYFYTKIISTPLYCLAEII